MKASKLISDLELYLSDVNLKSEVYAAAATQFFRNYYKPDGGRLVDQLVNRMMTVSTTTSFQLNKLIQFIDFYGYQDVVVDVDIHLQKPIYHPSALHYSELHTTNGTYRAAVLSASLYLEENRKLSAEKIAAGIKSELMVYDRVQIIAYLRWLTTTDYPEAKFFAQDFGNEKLIAIADGLDAPLKRDLLKAEKFKAAEEFDLDKFLMGCKTTDETAAILLLLEVKMNILTITSLATRSYDPLSGVITFDDKNVSVKGTMAQIHLDGMLKKYPRYPKHPLFNLTKNDIEISIKRGLKLIGKPEWDTLKLRKTFDLKSRESS